MGESRVQLAGSNKQLQAFEQSLLRDIQALELMLEDGWFEIDVTRIGAEQEFCLIDSNMKPAPMSMEALEKLDETFFTHELARFNMEVNLTPHEFKGKCLSAMEDDILKHLGEARETIQGLGGDIILSGIIPTIRKFDLHMDNITPMERYYALCKAINKLRGNLYELRINGIDELIVRHDSPLLEAANTGFQVHLQVNPDEFVKMYNIAQAITGPVLAAATNSPFLFTKRLWKETRVALFQQTVDTRTTSDHLREMSPRVTFGNSWLNKSILDIYKEDIVRYRVLLSSEINEDVAEKLKTGTAPDLMALKVHNSTVYRWNRPCYGISDGKAHLRIENRVLPAGPTVVDEMANAAFWLGLMQGYKDEIEDVRSLMEFSDAKNNFEKGARNGLETSFTWFDKKKVSAQDLIGETLLPIARKGLQKVNIAKEDIDRYLNIIEKRVSSGMTGADWYLDSYEKLRAQASTEETFASITASTVAQQATNKPVHEWPLAQVEDIPDWKPSAMLVEECMDKDLFTVQKGDIIQLVAEMMNWQKIRYVAVEDKKGRLVGLISSRTLLKVYTKNAHQGVDLPVTAKDIMIKNPLTTRPEAKITDAMSIMEQNQIGALPVVNNGLLVGMLTEQNFLEITSRLLKRLNR